MSPGWGDGIPAWRCLPGISVSERFSSPTWWLSTDVPVRSFLESDTASRVLKGKPFAAAVCCRRYWKHNLKTVRRLGTKRGGVYADGIHFRYQGRQVRSLLSLLSYLGSGKYRERYLSGRAGGQFGALPTPAASPTPTATAPPKYLPPPSTGTHLASVGQS